MKNSLKKENHFLSGGRSVKYGESRKISFGGVETLPHMDLIPLHNLELTFIQQYTYIKKGKPLQFGEIHFIVINNNFSLSLVAEHS